MAAANVVHSFWTYKWESRRVLPIFVCALTSLWFCEEENTCYPERKNCPNRVRTFDHSILSITLVKYHWISSSLLVNKNQKRTYPVKSQKRFLKFSGNRKAKSEKREVIRFLLAFISLVSCLVLAFFRFAWIWITPQSALKVWSII